VWELNVFEWCLFAECCDEWAKPTKPKKGR
jgi:hypothetical protein